jgi:soluble lytic murein transglycosylase-like protein
MQERFVRRIGMGVMSAVLLAAPPAMAASSVGPGKASPTSNLEEPSAQLRELIASHARRQGVPVDLARAVVRVESNFNPQARGRAGEIGLMQIKPQTARGIGFTGETEDLFDPNTNLRWGMRYLGTAYKLAGGSVCGTILRYSAGHDAKRMNPVSQRYCRKVLALMGRTGEGNKES